MKTYSIDSTGRPWSDGAGQWVREDDARSAIDHAYIRGRASVLANERAAQTMLDAINAELSDVVPNDCPTALERVRALRAIAYNDSVRALSRKKERDEARGVAARLAWADNRYPEVYQLDRAKADQWKKEGYGNA